ncbi:MAG: hypothetical protein GY820_22380 [Gammaproteobacteria bacterium]|nr:hypothetical protein [Gammaproteobacteria bacterium]
MKNPKKSNFGPCCSSLIGRLELRLCFRTNYPQGLQHTQTASKSKDFYESYEKKSFPLGSHGSVL